MAEEQARSEALGGGERQDPRGLCTAPSLPVVLVPPGQTPKGQFQGLGHVRSLPAQISLISTVFLAENIEVEQSAENSAYQPPRNSVFPNHNPPPGGFLRFTLCATTEER